MTKLFNKTGTNVFTLLENVDTFEKDKHDLISVGCKLTKEGTDQAGKYAHFVVPVEGTNHYHGFMLSNGYISFDMGDDYNDKTYKVEDYVHARKHGIDPDEMEADAKATSRAERDYD